MAVIQIEPTCPNSDACWPTSEILDFITANRAHFYLPCAPHRGAPSLRSGAAARGSWKHPCQFSELRQNLCVYPIVYHWEFVEILVPVLTPVPTSVLGMSYSNAKVNEFFLSKA